MFTMPLIFLTLSSALAVAKRDCGVYIAGLKINFSEGGCDEQLPLAAGILFLQIFSSPSKQYNLSWCWLTIITTITPNNFQKY
ncbi:hypothetical protein ACU8KH_05456 [Lachancea thermotolerans]